jgi:hypothetical protein
MCPEGLHKRSVAGALELRRERRSLIPAYMNLNVLEDVIVNEVKQSFESCVILKLTMRLYGDPSHVHETPALNCPITQSSNKASIEKLCP